MPSDPRAVIALGMLAGPIERYRSAVVNTAETVRGYLANHGSEIENGDENIAVGLGEFAAGRIDIDRFSKLLDNPVAAESDSLEQLQDAYELLSEVAAGGDELFRLELKSGGRLREAIAERLAEIGRAFSAARIASLATQGRLNAKSGAELGRLGFERWNEAERRVAPPLVVQLDGSDLRATDLVEFLDGQVKIALVTDGEAPPAALVRLITPATFVLQTDGEAGLERFAEFEGPAVAALVPEGCARFIHDPDRGPGLGERLEVHYVPEAAPGSAMGAMGAWQMTEELHQLRDLASAAAATATGVDSTEPGVAAATPDDPVDKLAAWLLSQADVDNLE